MNKEFYPERHILSIDLKSFFASCECIVRDLDPFKVPLVVANKKQGNGAITLAVTPFLKAQGVPSRGRLYEIPKNIKYMIVPPRMSLYIKMSEKVISIYLDYVSCEDLHIYSIDECFLDITNYLKLYKMSDYEIAKCILNDIRKKTGLTATCGIGPNILLAKVAMDMEAKKNKDGIAKWTYDDVKNKLWNISPLSKMWGIGSRMEKKLNTLGIYSVGDLAKFNKFSLKDKFGVIGEELWNHANGIDLSQINERYNLKLEKSYSNSQILFKDYYKNNIDIVIKEMVDIVTRRLRHNHKQALVVGLSIGYSKTFGGGFHRVMKLETPTDSEKDILKICMFIFEKYCQNYPIRKVGVSVGRLSDKDNIQLSLFDNLNAHLNEDKKNLVIDEITDKFGKNSLLRASALLPDSTIIERNKKIGGHSA